MCAFNQKFVQGATISQIRNAMNYSTFLITPEQERELKADKIMEAKIEDVSQPGPTIPANEIIHPAGPVGANDIPTLRRFTGSNLYE